MSSPTFLSVVGIFALVMTPTMSFADQFVLFDVTFTFTRDDADKSRPSKSNC